MVVRTLQRPSIHLKGTPSVKWILGICVIENTLVDDRRWEIVVKLTLPVSVFSVSMSLFFSFSSFGVRVSGVFLFTLPERSPSQTDNKINK